MSEACGGDVGFDKWWNMFGATRYHGGRELAYLAWEAGIADCLRLASPISEPASLSAYDMPTAKADADAPDRIVSTQIMRDGDLYVTTDDSVYLLYDDGTIRKVFDIDQLDKISDEVR